MDPWEGLDIDDSDLEMFVRRCNSTTNLILGPAGNVQTVLMNRNSSQPQNTQQMVKCIAEASLIEISVPINGNGRKNLLTFMVKLLRTKHT